MSAPTFAGVWVQVDVRYAPAGEICRSECPILGLSTTASTQQEARDAIIVAVADHLREKLKSGELEDYLARHYFVKDDQGMWLPRLSEGDERLAVRVSTARPIKLFVKPEPPAGE
jgi:hypothetical protein